MCPAHFLDDALQLTVDGRSVGLEAVMGVAKLERNVTLLVPQLKKIVRSEANPSESDLTVRVGLGMEVD